MKIVVLATVGGHTCDDHNQVPAVKQVIDQNNSTVRYLCQYCCERLAYLLTIGLTPDPVELQHEQEYDL